MSQISNETIWLENIITDEDIGLENIVPDEAIWLENNNEWSYLIGEH